MDDIGCTDRIDNGDALSDRDNFNQNFDVVFKVFGGQEVPMR